MTSPLATLSDLAAMLACSPKTARRKVLAAMEYDPGLKVIRRGRTLLFTPEQLQRINRALEWRSTSASVVRSGTHAAPSASGRRRSLSESSPQDAAIKLMQKLRQRTKQQKSGRPNLQALPGGRGL